jgi:hypothetical protein
MKLTGPRSASLGLNMNRAVAGRAASAPTPLNLGIHAVRIVGLSATIPTAGDGRTSSGPAIRTKRPFVLAPRWTVGVSRSGVIE